MAQAATLLNNLLAQMAANRREAVRAFTLPAARAGALRAALHIDGLDSLRTACLTIADAFGALDRRAYSWACIKLYYGCFYCVRAWLALADELHIYVDRSPFYMLVRAGERLTGGRGNSHQFAFERYCTRFSGLSIISQDIEAENPFTWLRSKREHIQYAEYGFLDPVSHELCQRWTASNPRQLLDFYLTVDETAPAYATIFDPAHAIVAFPLRLLADTINTIRQTNDFSLTAQQLEHCQRLCRIGGHQVLQKFRLLSV